MQDDLFFEYNPWWENDYIFEKIYPRSALENKIQEIMDLKAIIFLTGLRRAGKTTLMKAAINKLLVEGIPSKNIFYISIDDYLLKDRSILDIVTEYRQIHKLPVAEKVYLFLDDITYQPDFDQQLKNLYDRGHCKIISSASSSSALRDQSGLLTGRKRHIEVQPLTFEEFLTFRNIQIKKRDQNLLTAYLEDYMQTGGMPEYVLTQNREYLTALLDDIIYKDIIAYHGIKQSQVIIDYFKLLMERAGKQISINKVAKILAISPDTAKRYLTMFEESYLIHLVARYGKTNETLLSPKKVYAADLGIRHLFTGFRDKGAIFENLVFSIIKHKKPRYVYQDGVELDFITEDNVLIEVKYGQELNASQKLLFDKFSANEKIIIKNYGDLMQMSQV